MSGTRPDWRIHAAFLGVTLLLVAALYAPSLRHPFVLLDDGLFYRTDHYTAGMFWQLPLTMLSCRLDQALFGEGPFGAHLVQVLLHLANVALLYFLAFRILRRFVPEAGMRAAAGAAAFGAALFGLHPQQVEAVAWASGRKELLCLFFCLLSLHAYLSFRRRVTAPWIRSPYWWLALAFFAAAMLSKPSALCLPLVLVAFDMFLDGAARWRAWTDKAVFLALGLTVLMFQAHFGYQGFLYPNSFQASSFWERIPNAGFVVFHHFSKTLLPVDLVPFYFHYDDFTPMGAGQISVALAMLALAAALLFLGSRPVRLLSACFLVSLAPVCGFPAGPVIFPADRYFYIPSIWLAVAVAVAALALWRRAAAPVSVRVLLVGTAILLCLALLTLSRAQLRIWSASEQLLAHQVRTHPNPLFFEKVGDSLLLDGNVRAAVESYRNALRLHGANPRYLFKCAVAHDRAGNLELALFYAGECVKLDPAWREHPRLRAILEQEVKPPVAAEAR